MSREKTARWLDLVSFLAARSYPVARRDIFEHVKWYCEKLESRDAQQESVRRTFERDKDELREWGIDIRTVELPAGRAEEQLGYELSESHLYLPYLLLESYGTPPKDPYRKLDSVVLSDTDIQVLDRATRRLMEREELALSEAARSLRRKLEFDLPLSVESVERRLESPPHDGFGGVLDVLQEAISTQTAVSATYHTISRDAVAARVIEPYGLFLNWGKWYCVGLPRDRDDVRVFRVDRMSDPKLLTGEDAKFFVPDGFDITEFTNRPPWTLASEPTTESVVRFTFPESRWVQALGLGEVIEEIDGRGGALLRFDVSGRNQFLRWLLTFRGRAVVEQPADLVDEFNALKAEIAKLYRDKYDG